MLQTAIKAGSNNAQGDYSMNYGLTKTRVRLASGAAILALSAGAAMAQEAGVEQVVVSSTRLQSAGFDAPTPTTVVSSADLEKNAKPSVFDALTELPALQGSTGVSFNTGSTTTGLQGLSSLNLRALGVLRTLVLIDGQRVISANPNGAVDVSQMPQMLIQRVDIVTGGASASWGSDAVAGVVNFVTDKKFEGFKMNIQGGISTYGDDANATFQAAAGTSFLGGRGHIETSIEYSNTAGVSPKAPASQLFGTILTPGGRQFYSQYNTATLGTPSQYNGASNAVFYNSATPTYPKGTPTFAAGMPQYYYGNHAQDTTVYPYGLVTNGPKQGTIFGANGQAAPFNYAGGCTPTNAIYDLSNPAKGLGGGAAQVYGSLGGLCFGTNADPGDQTNHQWTHSLIDPLTRGDVYSRLSYDIAPDTEIFATVNLSTAKTQDIPAQGNSNRTGMNVQCDNAFLPATGLFGVGLTASQTQAACLALYPNITNADGTKVSGFGFASQVAQIPVLQTVNLQRDMRRFVVGGDGAFSVFGTDWNWDSYFQHGESDVTIRILNMPLKNRYNLAQDAIQDPVTGNIVCRNVAAQANGCVPFNPFGTDIASPSAISYIDNQGYGTKVGGPLAEQYMRQEAFSFNVSGSPIEDWAGKVTVAAGYDYREEWFAQTADPYSGGITASTPASEVYACTDASIDCVVSSASHVNPGNWNAGNYTSGGGNYHVNEAFFEAGIPLWNDTAIGKIDADLAGRFERYSTAGDIVAWKVGLTWETPIPGVRLRALQSRDVRAPNLADLYLPRQTLNGSFVNDFNTGVAASQQVGQTNAGNPLLKPEKGQTTEVGLVYQPDWLPGFQTSFDYYRIAVKGIISASGVQTVEDLCFQGFSTYCSQQFIATKNGAPQTVSAPGVKGSANEVLAIVAVPFNSAGLLTDGFDLESSYAFDLQDWDVPGHFVYRSLINHTSKFISDPGIPGQFASEKAGVLGGGFNSDTYSANTGNVLTWKITETQDWQGDMFGFSLTERWYAGGVMRGKWHEGGIQYITCNVGSCPAPTLQSPTTNYQYVPSIFYLDVGGNYNWNDKTQLYFKIDNITNVAPPNVGGNEVNNTLYDVIGRMYRIGLRFNN